VLKLCGIRRSRQAGIQLNGVRSSKRAVLRRKKLQIGAVAVLCVWRRPVSTVSIRCLHWSTRIAPTRPLVIKYCAYRRHSSWARRSMHHLNTQEKERPCPQTQGTAYRCRKARACWPFAPYKLDKLREDERRISINLLTAFMEGFPFLFDLAIVISRYTQSANNRKLRGVRTAQKLAANHTWCRQHARIARQHRLCIISNMIVEKAMDTNRQGLQALVMLSSSDALYDLRVELRRSRRGDSPCPPIVCILGLLDIKLYP